MKRSKPSPARTANLAVGLGHQLGDDRPQRLQACCHSSKCFVLLLHQQQAGRGLSARGCGCPHALRSGQTVQGSNKSARNSRVEMAATYDRRGNGYKGVFD